MADISKTSSYLASLYESTRLQIDNTVRSLQYDTTIKGVVTDASRASENVYKVRILNAVVQAVNLREGVTYRENEVVYVQIPQGNFDNDKFILGKEQNVEDNVYNYKWPFENFIELKLLTKTSGEYGYRANLSQAELLSDDTKWEIVTYGNPDNTPLVGNKLGIQMIVKSILGTYSPVQGEYGLVAELEGELIDPSGGATSTINKTYKFGSKNMVGNPYAYTIETKLQIMFDISEFKKINKIEFSFYQDCDFKNYQLEDISWKNDQGGAVPYNIILKDIEVYTGYNASDMDTNKVMLYTYDALTYNTDSDSNTIAVELNQRTVHCSVVYKDANDNWILCETVNDLIAHDILLYWYIKDITWTLDLHGNPKFNKIHEDDDDPYITDYMRYGASGWAPLSRVNSSDPPKSISVWNEDPYKDQVVLTFTPDLGIDNYTFKVVAVVGGTHMTSNSITFGNYQEPQKVALSLQAKNKIILRPALMLYPTDITSDTVSVLYPDESFSRFFVYDENNRVLNTSEKRSFYWPKVGSNRIELKGIDNERWSALLFYLEIWMRDDNGNIPDTVFHDDDDYVRLSDWLSSDNVAELFSVEWHLPNESASMLLMNPLTTSDSGASYFNFRLLTQVNFGGEYTNLFELDKLTTYGFHIRDAYDITRRENLVSVTVHRKGLSYTAQREFEFGRSMAQGCEYTPIIYISEPENANYLVSGQHFTLYCQVVDRYNSPYEGTYTCHWDFYGHEPAQGQYQESSMYSPSGNFEYTDAVLSGTLDNTGIPFVVSVRVTGIVEWSLVARKGMRVTNNGEFLVHHLVYCPNRVEFNSTGTAPKYDTSMFSVLSDGLDEVDGLARYIYPAWSLHCDAPVFKGNLKFKTTSRYNTERTIVGPQAEYDPNSTYEYMDGAQKDYRPYMRSEDEDLAIWNKATSTYNMFKLTTAPETRRYKSDSNIINYVFSRIDALPDPAFLYKLIFDAGADKSQGDVSNLWTWNENYNQDPSYFTYVSFLYNWYRPYTYSIPIEGPENEETQYETKVLTEWDVYQLIKTYLNDGQKDSIRSYIAQYNDLENSFKDWPEFKALLNNYLDADGDPGTQLSTYMSDVERAFIGQGHLLQYFLEQGAIYQNPINVTFAQAIAMDRNYYPSSLINEWDGLSLTLDEENGAILSTMLASGTKDFNNRFSGIMMGNWTTKGDTTFDTNKDSNDSGLWGFSKGETTFAFLDNGTGYIGPAGKGRIMFDGLNALISNATGSCYLNLNPNNYNDPSIVSNGGKSRYFLYCKIPKGMSSDILFYSEVNEYSNLAAKFNWANIFLDDEENDYIVVDPARGAIFSGGVISKYGKIGAWEIGPHGLYLKMINSTNGVLSNKNRFMYIGMPDVQKQAFDLVSSPFNTRIEQLIRERDQEVDIDFSVVEKALATLYPYLDLSMMSIDVYHYYNSVLAVQYCAEYLRKKLNAFDTGAAYSGDTDLLLLDIYNVPNLIAEVFTYDHVNMYPHNHYLHEFRTPAYFGLWPNFGTMMGFSGALSFSSRKYVITDLNDPEYAYYGASTPYNSYYTYSLSPRTDDFKGEGYTYSTNPIGEKRREFYDKANYDASINSKLSNLIRNNVSAENATLNITYVAQQEMNGKWWEPEIHPKDTNKTYFGKVWNNGVPKNISLNRPRSMLCYKTQLIDVDALRQFLDEWDIYYWYYAQFYNQVLYTMLESGYAKLAADSSVEGQEKYLAATREIERLGGLETIKANGVVLMSTGEEITFDEFGEYAEIWEKYWKQIRRDGYDRLIEQEKANRNAALRNWMNNVDVNDKYAIYCSYNPPSIDNYNYDPLFSVKWNGYLTARAGKIGKDSPWYISDAGLTQTNNFGTIFLGSPDLDGNIENMLNTRNVTYSGSTASATVVKSYSQGTRSAFLDDSGLPISTLLPNGSTILGKKAYLLNGEYTPTDTYNSVPISTITVNGIVDNNYEYPYYNITNWNSSKMKTALSNMPDGFNSENIKYLGPEAFGEYGNFAIYAGTHEAGIRFGVRLDGTLYSSRGQFENIKITGGAVHNVSSENFNRDNAGEPTYYTKTFSKMSIIHFRAWTGPGVRSDNWTNSVDVLFDENAVPNQDTTNYRSYVVVKAGDTISITDGELHNVMDWSPGDEIENEYYIYDGRDHKKETRVTVRTADGTFYYWKISTGDISPSNPVRWKRTGLGDLTRTEIIYNKNNNVPITRQIEDKNAILLGGSLTGWKIEPDLIYNNKTLSGTGETTAEGIALDAKYGQIRIHNSLIVLDGKDGVLFIGVPSVVQGHKTAAITNSHLWMGHTHITSLGAGVASYACGLVATYSAINTSAGAWGNESTTFNVQGIDVTKGELTNAEVRLNAYNNFYIKFKEDSAENEEVEATKREAFSGRGFGLLFSEDSENVEDEYCILYPLNNNSYLGMLGGLSGLSDSEGHSTNIGTDHLWNINANIVSAKALFLNNLKVATVEELANTMSKYSLNANSSINTVISNANATISELQSEISNLLSQNEGTINLNNQQLVNNVAEQKAELVRTWFTDITDEEWLTWSGNHPSLASKYGTWTVELTQTFVTWVLNNAEALEYTTDLESFLVALGDYN